MTSSYSAIEAIVFGSPRMCMTTQPAEHVRRDFDHSRIAEAGHVVDDSRTGGDGFRATSGL